MWIAIVYYLGHPERWHVLARHQRDAEAWASNLVRRLDPEGELVAVRPA